MIKQPMNMSTLKWNSSFAKGMEQKFSKSQQFIDNEVLKHSSKYIPFDDGALMRSGILHTRVGSGEVKYRTPYARRVYYGVGFKFKGSPTRGALWFEKVKTLHKSAILKGAREYAK